MCINRSGRSNVGFRSPRWISHSLLAGAMFVMLAGGPATAQSRWISGWTFVPTATMGPAVPPSPPNPNDIRGPLGPETVSNQTLTQTVRVTATGSALRIRFSNRHGANPVRLGAVSVSVADGPLIPVTFDGVSDVTIPAGAPRLSDPVALPVEALNHVTVSVYYPEETRLPVHRLRQVARAGNATREPVLPAADLARFGVLLNGIEVQTDRPTGVIVAFGDSITEGVTATPGGPGGWPEQLGSRLWGASDRWSVVNAGIAGNRLLRRGSGPSGLERLDSDVLAVPGIRCLIVFEGINDIGRPMQPAYAHETLTTEELIAGFRQVIARSRASGVKVILATIMPFEGAPYFSENGEAIRQQVNTWIRAGGEADGHIDFDQATRDPERPSSLLAIHDSGDRLHPSDAGYAAMAEAIPLTVCD